MQSLKLRDSSYANSFTLIISFTEEKLSINELKGDRGDRDGRCGK